ncbi:winged helix-turn-helix domain-containing protein [Pseudomonas plecoglossicida]|uniref:OmpR/PhoB-type domain-containing protein n=1 Tax=Pseudomonas plecoglossicida TaxID=70775 RepID=A0AAD0R2Z2_PSEDL|nr:winged helix-turn-helix domain-containing protein [Pseudomonas plecoglossicida]AXM98884.1 hypothetical protein DVB73_25330 [Pseudomonas plecoglossicida]EPB95253.1 transcriptional regulator CadC [Pseudomonas plecoglossicida NB2011]QLB55030.1 hypothetical protein HAV28_09325 [Pseudomonas plecoglossicida]
MTTFFPNIRTGHSEHAAIFCPVFHTLTVLKGEETEKIELGYAGGRLLARLMQEPGQLVPRATLIAHAWSDRIVGQGSLNQQVYTLRKILGDEKSRQIIQTVPRRGYLLNPAFLVAATPAPAPVTETFENPLDVTAQRPAPNNQPAVRSNTRRTRTVAIVLATLLLGYLYAALPSQHFPARLQGTENTNNRPPQTPKLISPPQTLTERLIKLQTERKTGRIGDTSTGKPLNTPGQPSENCTITLHDSVPPDLSDSRLRECVY